MIEMIGIILIVINKLFSEISTTIGKYEVSHRKESLYAMGFLNSLWMVIFLILIGIFVKGEFLFSIESLPTLSIRIVLEIILVFISLNAIIQADRSTFSFLRILTIPFILLVDLVLGYSISTYQLMGVVILVFTLALLLTKHGLGRRGKVLCAISALMAVATISLYKYNITHFNSVEAEQIIVQSAIILTMIIGAKIHTGENLFKYLKKKVFLAQSISSGVGTVASSFAYLFAPAAIIVAAERALEILFSMISGRTYFHEKHMVLKAISLFMIVGGLVLLTK